MASLALTNGNARSAIIDANLLPMIKSSLSHVSYGLRAAACQVVRALSRSTSILRTSLIDSGIGDEIVKLLKDEEPVWKERHDAVFASEIGESASVDARIDTVMTAATATICNLITEFSPVQAVSPFGLSNDLFPADSALYRIVYYRSGRYRAARQAEQRNALGCGTNECSVGATEFTLQERSQAEETSNGCVDLRRPVAVSHGMFNSHCCIC